MPTVDELSNLTAVLMALPVWWCQTRELGRVDAPFGLQVSKYEQSLTDSQQAGRGCKKTVLLLVNRLNVLQKYEATRV